MRKKIIAAAVAVVMFLGALPLAITAPNRSVDEIFAHFLAGPVERVFRPNVPVYAVEPVLAYPHVAGRLTDEFLQQGLHEANFVRYLAGLPADLVMDHAMNNRAQHGAALLAYSVQLTHSPRRPEQMEDEFFEMARQGTSASNLAWGAHSLWEAVLAYTHNSERNSISHLGHRRWILNPQLQRVGFGFVDRYSAMQVLDTSRRGRLDFDKILWPAMGNFPVEYMAGDQAWSVSLNPIIYDNTRTSNITVSLIRRIDGRVWRFTNENDDPNGNFFNVSTQAFGVPFCIIFRPYGIESYNSGDEFLVEISGVYLRTGIRTTITYEVSFFQLFEKIVLTIGEEQATATRSGRTEMFALDPNNGTTPILYQEITLVPLRSIVERMGGTMEFNDSNQNITIRYRDRVIRMGIGRHRVEVNGTFSNLDAVPQLINGTTMVPVRFISEQLGAAVRWNGDVQSVTIVYLPS